jgi:hypothetical protein
MAEEFRVFDFDDHEVKIGTRVRMWDYGPEHPEWGKHSKYNGRVIDLGEFEGDVDDEGRSRAIYPSITVLWDSGEKDSWTTTEWQFGYASTYYELEDMPDIEGKVEELSVAGFRAKKVTA